MLKRGSKILLCLFAVVILGVLAISLVNFVSAAAPTQKYDFGGMYSQGAASYVNPATGDFSCPDGYRPTRVFGNDYSASGSRRTFDAWIFICTRNYTGNGKYDFGGMFSYSSFDKNYYTNPISERYGVKDGSGDLQPIGHNCPPGYDAQQVFGYAGNNWHDPDGLLYFCYKNHDSDSGEEYFFGGMEWSVLDYDKGNEVSSSCLGGNYQKVKVLGGGADDVLEYCYYDNKDYGSMEDYGFGGMYGRGAATYVNPATGDFSCPEGYEDIQVLNADGHFHGRNKIIDYGLHYCIIKGEGIYDFGGMYSGGEIVTNKYYNPVTNQKLGCPSGYAPHKIFGSSGSGLDWFDGDATMFFCYKEHELGTTSEYGFGGLYSESYGGGYKHFIEEAKRCPSSYESIQVLGAADTDANLFLCINDTTKISTSTSRSFVSTNLNIVDFGSDIGNDYLVDYSNGLMWKKVSGVNTMRYADAVNYCGLLNVGGYDDWRMSTKEEGSALIKENLEDVGGVYGGAGFWTSDVNLPNLIGQVIMSDGDVVNGSIFNDNNFPLCVRDADLPTGLESCRLGEHFFGQGYLQACGYGRDLCADGNEHCWREPEHNYFNAFNTVDIEGTSLSLLNNGFCNLITVHDRPDSLCPEYSDTPENRCWARYGDIQYLSVDCGDQSFVQDCELCSRSIPPGSGGRTFNYDCVPFNGEELEINFNANGDSTIGMVLDFKANCSQEVQDVCELCRNYNGVDECVPLNGTELWTTFNEQPGRHTQFDLRIDCAIDRSTSGVVKEKDYFEQGTCFDLSNLPNGINDSCNEFNVIEYYNNATGECDEDVHPCSYGCLGGACLESPNDAYFVFTKQGSFNLSLNEIIPDNALSNVNFRTNRFRLAVDSRLLTALELDQGYDGNSISSDFDKNSYARIFSIVRHNYENEEDVLDAFKPTTIDFGVVESADIIDLTSLSYDELYLFAHEDFGNYQVSNVPLPISSVRKGYNITDFEEYSDFFLSGEVPDFTSGVFSEQGSYGYGSGAYVYVDAAGDLRFEYETQNDYSRAVYSVGILVCECSPDETRCINENLPGGGRYEICTDGCSWENQGKAIGYCNVEPQCEDDDAGKDYSQKGIVTYISEGEPELSLDSCDASTGNLTEYYCQGTEVMEEVYNCPLGCDDGKCLTCEDIDGSDFAESSSVRVYDSFSEIVSEFPDICSGQDVVEKICNDDGGVSYEIFDECPSGCEKGACKKMECSVNLTLCPLSSEEVLNGTVHYSFDGEKVCRVVGDYFFEETDGCAAIEECELGVNVTTKACIVQTCKDEDLGSGMDNFTLSRAVDNLGNDLEDFCHEDGATLSEAICSVDGVAVYNDVDCKIGCSNGKCVGEVNCSSEGDNGLDYFVKGRTIQCIDDVCNAPENESCVDEMVVWESSCGRDNEIVWQKQMCPEDCEDGACVVPEEKIEAGVGATCDSTSVGKPRINPGIRLVNEGTLVYCDPITLELLEIKALNETCYNDYECDSNICIEGRCTNIRGELEEQRVILEQQVGLLNQIRCYLRDILGLEVSDDCEGISAGALEA